MTFPITKLPGCGNVDLVHGNIAIADDRMSFGGDFDELRDFEGVPLATAVIEGTVVDGEADRIALPNGYTATKSGESPTITELEDVTLSTVLRPDRMAELESSISQSKVSLTHYNGFLEPGHRYSFFVSAVPSDVTMLYGHDLETDLPVHGFMSEASVRILRSLESAVSTGCNIDRLIQLAIDSIEIKGLSGAEALDVRSDLVSAAYDLPLPIEFEDYLETTYPLLDARGSYSGPEIDDPVFVEVLILSDEPGMYALRGEKYFGRSPINSLGQTFILGLVPPKATFFSVVWTDPEGAIHELPLSDNGSPLVIVRAADIPVAQVLIDLTAGKRAGDYLGDRRTAILSTREFFAAAIDIGSDGQIDLPAGLLDGAASE